LEVQARIPRLRERKNFHCHRTALNITTHVISSAALPLDALEEMMFGHFWPTNATTRAARKVRVAFIL